MQDRKEGRKEGATPTPPDDPALWSFIASHLVPRLRCYFERWDATRSEGDDLVQETLLQLVRATRRLRIVAVADVAKLAMKTAHDVRASHVRASRKGQTLTEVLRAPELDGDRADVDLAALLALRPRLEPRLRGQAARVFRAIVDDGLASVRAIARAIGTQPQRVRQHVRTIHRRVDQLRGAQGDEDAAGDGQA